MIELWFMFSMIWSVCCSVDEEGRKKIDAYLREIDGSFPNKDTIYEYFVEPKTRSWVHWEEKLKQGWKLNPRYVLFGFNHSHVSVLVHNVVSWITKKRRWRGNKICGCFVAFWKFLSIQTIASANKPNSPLHYGRRWDVVKNTARRSLSLYSFSIRRECWPM